MSQEKARVLIADQLPLVRAGLRLLIGQSDGLTVAGEAVDATNLIRLAREQSADVILLEWGLPGQSAGTMRALRASRPHMAVIALSANPEMRPRALDAGVDGFVSKLDPPDRLLDMVRRCLRNAHDSCMAG